VSTCVKLCQVVSSCVKLCQGVSSSVKLCQGNLLERGSRTEPYVKVWSIMKPLET
jgi:hypothetical protein